ncbi:MAG: riboflavin biosynthesis protein RibF [Clostridiales bacterium]|nr:riboflavin biosynthesis protein RibF [Clostridiales bacterium]
MKNKVLALGYFDAIHKGHQMLLKKAEKIASERGDELLICTFGDDFYKSLGKESKEVFTLSERKEILSKLGYNNILVLDTSKEFFDKSKELFLHYLVNLNPTAIVVGSDYRFGKNAKGKSCDLQVFFSKLNVKVEALDLLLEKDQKVSTTLIKEHLTSGDIKSVNRLLGFEYFLSGTVIKGRQVGSTLGIPTANIDISHNKLSPKDGVYVSKIEICDKTYLGVTNIGAHPTFNDDNFNVETHIIGFDSDIYCQDVKVKLIKYIRDIIQFNNKQELIDQIHNDMIIAKEEVLND